MHGRRFPVDSGRSWKSRVVSSVEPERRPAYRCVKQCHAHQRLSAKVTKQAQCFLAVSLHDDNVSGLLAMARQRIAAHSCRNVVDLGEIQDLIDDSHDMDDLARTVNNRSVHQLVGHGASSIPARSCGRAGIAYGYWNIFAA